MDPGAQVRKDATVKVRARSVLGEKYLAVVPGSPTAPLLVDGDALSAGPPQVEIDQLVTALGPLVEAVDPEVIARVLHSVDDLLADDPEVLARILAEHLPGGVVNVVCGRGESVGSGLVEHPDVRLVSLTGDISTGVAV
ncbi:MAG: aldehyde dehydrogenase family protein, partial [Myxococcales bacterium]|nr:aldehyde dehydrogenase family protein [Myxococcales bacterium]